MVRLGVVATHKVRFTDDYSFDASVDREKGGPNGDTQREEVRKRLCGDALPTLPKALRNTSPNKVTPPSYTTTKEQTLPTPSGMLGG